MSRLGWQNRPRDLFPLFGPSMHKPKGCCALKWMDVQVRALLCRQIRHHTCDIFQLSSSRLWTFATHGFCPLQQFWLKHDKIPASLLFFFINLKCLLISSSRCLVSTFNYLLKVAHLISLQFNCLRSPHIFILPSNSTVSYASRLVQHDSMPSSMQCNAS